MPTIPPNNNTGLYGSSASSPSIPTNNTTGLYAIDNGSIYLNNDIIADQISANSIVATGNVTAANFIGNLQGPVTGNVTGDVTGNLNGNVTGGNIVANYATINNDLTVGGTIYGTFSGNVTGNVVVPGTNTDVLFNNYGNIGASSDFRFNDATNVLTVAGTANVSALNVTSAGNTWNISGEKITSPDGGEWRSDTLNNDEYLTSGLDGYINLQSLYANGVVASQVHLEHGLAHITANNGTPKIWNFYGNALLEAPGAITATGNITANYFIGNGSQLTGLPASYGNANVANYLPTFTGNLSGGNLVITGNANIAALTITGSSNISVNYNRIIDLGDPIAGNDAVNKSYVDSQISGDLFAIQDDIGSTQGIPKAGTILFSGVINETTVSVSSPDTVIIGLPDDVSLVGNLTAGGNITASGQFIGNAAGLTSIPGGNVTGQVANALIAGTVYVNAQPNITSVGMLTGLTVNGLINATDISTTGNVTITGNLFSDDITSTNVTVYGDQVITGNLTVQGNTTTINSNVITTNDKTITVANNQSTQANLDGAGLEAGNPALATWLYNALTDSWQSNVGITPKANNSVSLGGTSNYWSSIYAGSATLAGNVTAGNVTASGNIIANNLVTNNTLYFGTDTPEEYINSGDLTMSFVTNNNIRLALTSGNSVFYQSIWVTSGNIRTNSGNVIASDAIIAASGSITGNVSAANLVASNIVQGAYLYGDGGNITGVVAGSASTQIPVKNTSSGTITKGTPVYATGTVGASTTLEIAPSLGNTAATMPCIGLVTTTLGINDQGYAISVGTLKNVDTSAYSIGQTLYVAAGGGLTATRPSGTNLVQPVGSVGRVDASNGSIETNIWNYLQLPNLGNGNVWIGNASGYPTEQVAYSDANVAAYLPTYTGNLSANNVFATGNISGNYILGNGSLLTGVASSSNTFSTISANGTSVVADSSSDTVTFTPGNNMVITGNASTDTIIYAVADAPSFSGNVTAPNYNVDGSLIFTTAAYPIVLTVGNIDAQWQGVSIGPYASSQNTSSRISSISIGKFAGFQGQQASTVAIGAAAGQFTQNEYAIAIGQSAGNSNQSQKATAIGYLTAQTTQGVSAVAVGSEAGNDNQGDYAVAIGTMAAANNQGDYAVAIGFAAGNVSQPANSIILNASSSALNGNNSGFYVNPVRNDTGNVTNAVYYNTSTKELTYGAAGGTATLSGNLAGDIYANGFSITSLSNGNVTITANGTGFVNTSRQKMLTFGETVYAMGNVTGNLAANIDINNGSIQTMTLTGNITANSIGNMTSGQSLTMIMTQDSTGNRLLSSTMKFAGGFKTLSTGNTITDIVTVFYDGTNYYASLSRGYA